MDPTRIGVPTGIRTPVATVKGSCPRPLDDGDTGKWWSQTGSNRRPLACHASALPAELWPRCRGAELSGGEVLLSTTWGDLPTPRGRSARGYGRGIGRAPA